MTFIIKRIIKAGVYIGMFVTCLMMITSCFSSNKAALAQRLEGSVKECYAWVNLMPGGKPKFHITGTLELSIFNAREDSVRLDSIKIRQGSGGQLLYCFQPEVVENEINADKTDTVVKRVLQFSDGGGIFINPVFDNDREFKAEFVFKGISDTMSVFSKELKIERVY